MKCKSFYCSSRALMDCGRLLAITSPDHQDSSRNRWDTSSINDEISCVVIGVGKTLERGRSRSIIGDKWSLLSVQTMFRSLEKLCGHSFIFCSAIWYTGILLHVPPKAFDGSSRLLRCSWIRSYELCSVLFYCLDEHVWLFDKLRMWRIFHPNVRFFELRTCENEISWNKLLMPCKSLISCRLEKNRS